MPKVMTIVGTRPELIRLSRVIALLDEVLEHVLVHTGQNFDPSLKEVFFRELGIRPPDHNLAVTTRSPGAMLADLFSRVEACLEREKPDALLILGDTNSALACIVARKHGIPIYHMEAGNRSFDRESPEEANRRIIDHTCDYNLVYSEPARRNLLREGLPPSRIHLTGSPLREVIAHHRDAIERSDALERLGVAPGRYLLASLHRQEAIDRPERLRGLVQALRTVHAETGLPVLLSTHPRLRQRLAESGLPAPPGVRPLEPFGFHDWCRLQSRAGCVISDSGTVSEEAAMLGFPAVTPRRAMERPEALECGNVVLCGIASDAIVSSVLMLLGGKLGSPRHIPPEYDVADVSRRVAALIAGTYALDAP